DHAGDGIAVAAEELGCGVDDNVRAPLDGAKERRRSAGVVDHQRKLVLVGDGGQRLDVGDIELGIAEALSVNSARFAVDGGAQAGEIVAVDEANLDAEARQRVVEEIVGSAVERAGGDDFIACGRERGESQGFSSLPGGDRQRRDPTFESGYALFKDV